MPTQSAVTQIDCQQKIDPRSQWTPEKLQEQAVEVLKGHDKHHMANVRVSPCLSAEHLRAILFLHLRAGSLRIKHVECIWTPHCLSADWLLCACQKALANLMTLYRA